MAVEEYLLENRYLEPLGWCLIGVTILAAEGYTLAVSGPSSAGGVMAVVGLASLVIGGRRWTERDAMADPRGVSVVKHLFLAAVVLVIVGGQLFGLP